MYATYANGSRDKKNASKPPLIMGKFMNCLHMNFCQWQTCGPNTGNLSRENSMCFFHSLPLCLSSLGGLNLQLVIAAICYCPKIDLSTLFSLVDFGLSWIHDTNTVWQICPIDCTPKWKSRCIPLQSVFWPVEYCMALRSKYKFSAFPILPQPPECHRLQKRMANATKKNQPKRNGKRIREKIKMTWAEIGKKSCDRNGRRRKKWLLEFSEKCRRWSSCSTVRIEYQQREIY